MRLWVAGFLILAGVVAVFSYYVGNSARHIPSSLSAHMTDEGAGDNTPATAIPSVKPMELQPLTAEDARVKNAAIAFASGPLVAARPFRFNGTPLDRNRAIDCLAAAAWYEAGDDAVGQSSVAQVVLNRARHPAFPASICAVVFQGAERTTGCQFTFTCDGALLRRKPSPAAWARAQAIATSALSGRVDKRIGLATHYHTDWVMPYWSGSLDKIAQVRTHLFFKWRGYWGTAGAFHGNAAIAEPVIAGMATLSPFHGDVAMADAGGTLPDAMTADPADAPRKVNYADRAQNFPGEAARGMRDLKGNQVVAQSEDGRRYLIALNPAVDAHIYALSALTLCRGKPNCDVRGWSPAQTPRTLSEAPTASSSMRFHFRRAVGSDEVAQWDCTATPRPRPEQCL